MVIWNNEDELEKEKLMFRIISLKYYLELFHSV